MSSKTKNTVTISPEERAYYASQQQLATKQLELLTSQSSQQQDYLNQIKPLLDQQTTLTKQIYDQQQAALNDPVQQQLAKQQNDLLLSQVQGQQALQPLQQQVLEAQLKQALNGNQATPEQISQINAATDAAMQRGTSDINQFSTDAVTKLRDELAPALGLRPTDTPIIDRGGLVAKEATRQVGNLSSDLAVANANAQLNYPLAAGQVSQAASNSAANIAQATQQFQAQLAQQAAQNRLNLLASGNQSADLGLTSGANLISASRPNPANFARSTTTTNSPGFIDYLGAIAGGAKGAGSAYADFSDRRLKKNITTAGYDKKGRRWVDFEYKGDPKNRRFRGVIAQEIEKSDPLAVLTRGDGIKLVDYSKLKDAA